MIFFLNVTISVAPSAVRCWKHPEQYLNWWEEVAEQWRSHRHSAMMEDVFSDTAHSSCQFAGVAEERGGRGEGGVASGGGCSGCSSCGGPANTVTSLSQETQVAPTREAE